MGSVILTFIGFNLTTEFNCNVCDYSSNPHLVSVGLILPRCGSVVPSFAHGSPSPLLRSFSCFVGTYYTVRHLHRGDCRLIASINNQCRHLGPRQTRHTSRSANLVREHSNGILE
jgi:hypothetical protein